jgi:hypothetical protein
VQLAVVHCAKRELDASDLNPACQHMESYFTDVTECMFALQASSHIQWLLRVSRSFARQCVCTRISTYVCNSRILAVHAHVSEFANTYPMCVQVVAGQHVFLYRDAGPNIESWYGCTHPHLRALIVYGFFLRFL